ncbi:MAG: ATP-binding protein, partial [Candidatus Hydrogenedentes bacterium]|nr:ATP-binding protein [Candidatus Hydrogenedentota bacterium]
DEIQTNLDSHAMIRKLAAIAIRESDHLNGIVSGFLDFAREPILKRETVDLRGLVDEVREFLVHEYAPYEDLRIETVFPDGGAPCLVHGAQSQLRQVLVNLGHNAVEAMDGHGTVTMSVVPSSPGSFEMRVEDEGPGIPPDKITRIFDPFYTDKESGVGMGLAICSRIVTAHNGVIWADSRQGGGASLTVRLPAASA